MTEILPANKRFKQLIAEHGRLWLELERKSVSCFDGKIGVLIESLDKTHTRWVMPTLLQEIKND